MFDSKKSLGKLVLLAPDAIVPSPYQARDVFETAELEALALSIRENGLLQPISVRRVQGGTYELIAGERRLRACKMIGMEKIPAIVCNFEEEQSASLSLLENLQRQDLNPFEQARGISAMILLWECTQNEAAKRLGMAQPTLANKLRLLQLSPEAQEFVLAHGLNERHARACLRLPERARVAALAKMAKDGMNAREADAYVERLVQLQTKERKPKPRKRAMIRDVRLFVNTINNAVRLMTENGVQATTNKTEGEGFIEYTVRIPTASGARAE